MNRINNSHQNNNANWTALVSLNGLEILKQHAPDARLLSRVDPGKTMLIVLRPLAVNIAWVCAELNRLRSSSREAALRGLDRAIEGGLLEIIGFETGDEEANTQVSRRVEDLCGIVIHP